MRNKDGTDGELVLGAMVETAAPSFLHCAWTSRGWSFDVSPGVVDEDHVRAIEVQGLHREEETPTKAVPHVRTGGIVLD